MTFKQSFLLLAGRTQCWIEMSPWQWKLYISIVATTVFVVPAIVISGCYAIIVYTIWSKSKLLSPAKNNTLQRGAKSELLYIINYNIIGPITYHWYTHILIMSREDSSRMCLMGKSCIEIGTYSILPTNIKMFKISIICFDFFKCIIIHFCWMDNCKKNEIFRFRFQFYLSILFFF